jgi:hypothetical protein
LVGLIIAKLFSYVVLHYCSGSSGDDGGDDGGLLQTLSVSLQSGLAQIALLLELKTIVAFEFIGLS